VRILREEGFHDGGKSVGAKGGVVHSFTGTVAEVVELVSASSISPELALMTFSLSQMDMGFHIRYFLPFHIRTHPITIFSSVNGCSLKTEENLKAAQAIRPEAILLETGMSLPHQTRQPSQACS